MMGLQRTAPLSSSPCSPRLKDTPNRESVAGNSSGTVRPRAKRACRQRFNRTVLGGIIRTQPCLPLTSERGKKLLIEHNEYSANGLVPAVKQNPTNDAYKHLSSRVTKAPHCPEPTVVTTKKHMLKEHEYAHIFSFTKAERKQREIELKIGKL
jgi:hypothetical protein